ncbi:hypothetical protein HBI56_232310 [Parastagonospora nodorum]|uniref:Uncharacterized protein n=1 Tax=Phaeosphaeria nodorum (strain SN15 / ATCC MYA-4574 / FGSC 10173) TaxID=321614 RepID=A0A7U2I182_PHANO|nr:hypothetical protein HBH56_235630 [Parastagonospora nodorum]QRC99540.1 hypothetical protein JI435_144490 [Parastagonospora nodorum SN15]KAH3924448.1 hypothetical protein HBH54_192760 [Parastagonospora nodorum]KAH3957151.1 hypothetical protein HBH51_229850 [Parastagonospora nodorum]KAH3959430.1 hypothetical protein HBH52_244020 [Parastagonospora nodorum]
MKLTILVGALSAVYVMASPHASRLNRPFKEVQVAATPTANIPSGTYQIACVECPCDGFDGPCHCVSDGCCCNGGPIQPPATGWRNADDI